MLWRLARATRKRAAQISATRLAVEEIVALSATPLPGNVPAVVVTDVRPAAWCIPGRLGRSSNDGIIVVTSGAAELLAPAELHAVLAHERQHLTGHHQRYTTVMTLCTAMLQWLPGLTTRSATVAELLEMSADDHAAATYGHEAVATALLTLAPLAGHKPPLALAISGTPAARRIDRLLDATDPSEQPRTWRSLAAFLLATFTPLLVAVAPAIVVTVSGLCHV